MPDSRYTAPARLLHWIMAALILPMIPAGLIMVQPGLDRGLQNALFLYHKNAGVLLLVLVVARLVWRQMSPPPAPPAHLAGWQVRIAEATHLGLYVLLIVLPVAGYVRVRAGGFPIESLDALGIPALVPRSDTLADVAKTVHYLSGLAIAVLVAMHVGAALMHGIVKRDGVFSRMWPPLGGGPAPR
ncbi:MAG: cytochrome b [Rhodobacterales bacterium]|nr:cytochrome b [Rhodobacterales bacterium]